MKSISNIRFIYIFFSVLFAALVCSFMFVLNLMVQDPRLWIITVGFAITTMGLGILFILTLRKQVHNFGTSFSLYLDKMINREWEEVYHTNTDTLDDKLLHKFQRLSEIMESDNKNIIKDRQQIQETITDIAHQVKTPLANLRMYNATMLMRDLPKEKEQEFLAAMENQILKLDFLFDSMVKMSRLEAGMVLLASKAIPIYDTILLALDSAFIKAEEKKIDISVVCDPSIMVHHDQKWTAEALLNIIDNAIKYSAQGSKITINVARWEMLTQIDIIDTGKGIAEKNLAQIFKRFYRENDVHEVEGVGVGLYLSREIITKQGGTLQAKSILGTGSTFSIHFRNDKKITI